MQAVIFSFLTWTQAMFNSENESTNESSVGRDLFMVEIEHRTMFYTLFRH